MLFELKFRLKKAVCREVDYFLGGDRSIQLSYGGVYRKYSILQGSRIRTIRFLGGGPSILVRYGGI